MEDAEARVRNAFNTMMSGIDKDIIRQRQVGNLLIVVVLFLHGRLSYFLAM